MSESEETTYFDQAFLKRLIEAVLLASGRPMNLDQLLALFDEQERPSRTLMRESVEALRDDLQGRGIELVEVASGYRMQVPEDLAPWVLRMWEEKPGRYSRALLETLALIAYRQPITRAEVEDIRGVSVSTSIMKTLQEREWVRIVGHRDVPGRPAMYGTTRQFLDYFGLKSLDELPTLAEIRDIESINAELNLDDPEMRVDDDGVVRDEHTRDLLRDDSEFDELESESLTEEEDDSPTPDLLEPEARE